jgi:hypothetical protein
MLKQTIPKKTKLKTYNKGVCPMRKFLFILPVLMTAFLILPSAKAYADAFTVDSLTTSLLPFDTVYCGATKVPIFGFKIKPSSPDTLQRVTVTSFIEKAFSVKKAYLYRENGAAGFQGTEQLLRSVDITGRFDVNDTVQFSAQNMYVFTDTSTKVFYVVVDIKNDTVCARPIDYDETGLDAIIDTNDITFKDGTEGPLARVHSKAFNPGPPPSGIYRVYFDTEPPAFCLHWDWVTDHCATDIINLLDTLVIWADGGYAEKTKDDLSCEGDTSDVAGDITIDLSFLGQSSFKLEKSENYTDTIVIPDEEIAECIDVIAGYTVTGYGEDKAGNTGSAQLVFDKPIDTCNPKIDSLKFFISYDANGDGIAALGDSLTIWAYCTSNPAWEIDSVVANISNFFNSTTTLKLDDVTNNNWIFRGKFLLDEAKALDIPADSLLNRIWVTAWDNACNTKLDSIDLEKPVDLEPPSIDGGNYAALMDFDSSGCINIGDSVLIRVTTDATVDVESVMARVLSAGIGVTPTVALVDSGSNVWRLPWEVLEPPSDSAKDANSSPIDNDFSVWCFVYDDAGNYDSTNLDLDKTLDTRRPTAIIKDSIRVQAMPAGKIRLQWHKNSPPQAEDPQYFWVYVDSTGGGFDFNTPFGATFNGECGLTDSNCWTSEVLTSGKIYKFVIRTEDDCANWEFNTNIIEAIPDATPPLICIIEPDTGLSFGSCTNCLKVKALTADMDAASARIWYRIKDIGGGVPGPWINWGVNMHTLPGDSTYPGRKVFIDTLCSFPGTDTYELIVVGTDLVGNITPIDTAYLACSPQFFFHWYDEQVVANIVSINGAYNPQSACGYDVTRDTLNQAVVTINDTSYNEPVYTVDSWVLRWNGVNYDSTRITYAENQTMPYAFDFNAGDWPKGKQKIFVTITDSRSKCSGKDSVFVCVPDTLAPQASIVYPLYGQRVHKASSSLNFVDVKAKVNFNALDPKVVANVHFFYITSDMTDTVLIQKVLGTDYTVVGSETLWVAKWDNSNFNNGDTVYLMAIFYDELHNEYLTPLVLVVVDANVPDIVLNIPQMKMINGVQKVAGTIDLIAQLNDTVTVNDIAEVKFYCKRSDKPDLFWYYTLIGTGTKITNSSIWKYESVNTGAWDDQYWWDIRAIAKDIAGNVMWDSDGDQLFDDYTFNPLNPSDKKVFVDNTAPQPVITSVASISLDDTLETVNPSLWLGGSGKAFVQAGKLVQIKTNALRWPPYDMMVDTAEVQKMEYTITGSHHHDYSIGYRESYPYTLTFNPADLGYTAIDGYDSFKLTAICYDWLGNAVKQDTVRVYILDVTGNQVVITEPENNSYNRRDIDLEAAALNEAWDDIKAVTYQYGVMSWAIGKGAQTETTWYDIATVLTESRRQVSKILEAVTPHPRPPDWDTLWQTFNNDLNHNGIYGDDDGWYLLRTISEDSAGNTAIGPMLKINVTNHNPVAYMIMPNDSTIIGGHQNIRGHFDVNIQSVAKKYAPSSAGIDYFRAYWKSQTEDHFDEVPWADDLTLVGDSIYALGWNVDGKHTGWYHLAGLVHDSAGNESWTDTLSIFIDNTDPDGRVMFINSDYNTWYKDITTPDTTLIVARAWDLPADYNAGLDTVQFRIYNDSIHYSFLGTPLGPDADGQYWLTWNHAGLPAGTYWVSLYLVDKVNNSETSISTPLIIKDVTIPVGVVRAFHPMYIFASTENQVDYLQIQYQPYTVTLGGSDWINLGLATTYGSYDDLWWTPWVPTSLAGTEDKEYLFRAVPMRGEMDKGGVKKLVALDNFVAPTVHVTITPEGEVITQGTDAIGPMSFEANLAADTKGTATFIQTTKKPYLLVIYSDLAGDVKNAVVTDVLEESGATERWNSVFNVTDINAIGGSAEFHASIYDASLNTAYIERNGFDIAKVTVDLGTNGWITSMDNYAKINIPAGAVEDTLNLVILPTEKPVYIPNSCKEYIPIGNVNGLLEKFCLYDYGSYLESGPGSGGIVEEVETGFKATLFYNDAEVTGGEANLVVGWWNPSTSCWEFDGIMDPVVDTENNSITFLAYQLGLYAVLAKGSPITATIELEPNCSGYTYKYPLFKAVIQDENMEVDASTIVVRYRSIGGAWMMAYQNNDYTADFDHPYDFHDGYDSGSGILKLEKVQPFAPGTYEVEVKARNINGIFAADTATFTVETSTPMVNVPDGYVYKNPSFTFTVKDTGSGVDRNKVFVDLYSATKSDSSYYLWSRKYIETITPTSMEWLNDTTVKVSTTYFLRTGQYLDVVVYDGEWNSYYDHPGDYDYRAYDLDEGVNDCVGNEAYIVEKRFTVDWTAPTITLLSNRWVTPLIFKVIDNECGVTKDRIIITEGGVPASPDSFTYDPATGILTYRPPTSGAVVNITVTDCVGNATYYPPFFAISDDAAPNVVFVGGNELYKAKDPTVKVRVYDVGGAGIDWDSVKVDVWKGDYLFVTLGPTDVKNALSGDTIVIKLPDYTDATDLRVVVYSYKSGTSSYPYMADYYKKGVYDLAGNYASPAFHSWRVDTAAPYTAEYDLSDRPVEIQFTDAGSGIDWTTLSVTPCDSFKYDAATGMVYIYLPDGSFDVTVTVADNVGNIFIQSFTVEAKELTVADPHNYPNPFDGTTTILAGNSKTAYLTVKIYDFAGDLVKTLASGQSYGGNASLIWDGKTDKGEMVANGIYLCHILAKDSDGKTATAVIKIAVVKKD